MICKRCGKKIEKGWRYCPNCGSVTQGMGKSLFDDIFSRLREEFMGIDKAFERFDKEFEVLDLSPFFRQQRSPAGRGFTIKITRRSNEPPKVDIKTFGNVDKNEIRKEVTEEMQSIGINSGPLPEPEKKAEEKPAKVTAEPNTHVRSLGTKLLVEMELDDVKSENDIHINELESSVEVKAKAGEKVYFKIIRKPEQFSISSRRFENGKLYLEFS